MAIFHIRRENFHRLPTSKNKGPTTRKGSKGIIFGCQDRGFDSSHKRPKKFHRGNLESMEAKFTSMDAKFDTLASNQDSKFVAISDALAQTC
ncbi:MAG: hypothetical protein AB2693_28375 [Candidatus Thiodiazotropha sp.]